MPLGVAEAIQQEKVYPVGSGESGTGGTNLTGIPGPWEPASNNAAGLKYEDVTEFKVSRLESGNKTVRLRGKFKTAAAQPITAGTPILSLKGVPFKPEKAQPFTAYDLTAKAVIQCEVTTGPSITCSTEILAEHEFTFWDITYSLN